MQLPMLNRKDEGQLLLHTFHINIGSTQKMPSMNCFIRCEFGSICPRPFYTHAANSTLLSLILPFYLMLRKCCHRSHLLGSEKLDIQPLFICIHEAVSNCV